MSAHDEGEDDAIVHNAADSRQVRDARKKVRQAERRTREEMRAVLSSEAGRNVLWRIVEHCAPFSCALGATDAQTNFAVGRQDVGHFLVAAITEASPEAFIAMMRANLKETHE